MAHLHMVSDKGFALVLLATLCALPEVAPRLLAEHLGHEVAQQAVPEIPCTVVRPHLHSWEIYGLSAT